MKSPSLGAAYACMLQDRLDTARTIYLEAAAAWEDDRRQALSPQWRERRGTNGRKIFPDLGLLIHQSGSPAEAFDRLQAYKSRTLLERISGPGEALPDSVGRQEALSISLDEVQNQLLADNELLLDFTLGPHGSLLYAVTRDTLVLRRLPKIEVIAPRVQAYYDLLQDPQAGSPALIAAMGRDLAALLLSDLPAVFPAHTRFLVAPDGLLHLLPFAALEIAGRDPEWVRLPSAAILMQVRRDNRDAPIEPWRTLAVASKSESSRVQLTGTIREVDLLSRNYKNVQSQILTGDETELPSLAGFDILHLAAHASNDDQSPWQSAIQFFAAERNGHLRAADVLNIELDASLAVLSSCSSGTGKIINGEGVLGLSSAFLGAGVPAVLASLWAVDDGATAQFMTYFYEFLAAGEDCGAALNTTQRQLRRHATTAHPYYWAGFVLVGDGAVQPHLIAARNWRRPVGVGVLVVGLLEVGVVLRKRRARDHLAK